MCTYDSGRNCEVLTFATCSQHPNFGLSPTPGDVCLRRPDAIFYCGKGVLQTGRTPTPPAPFNPATPATVYPAFYNRLPLRPSRGLMIGRFVGTIKLNANGIARRNVGPGPNTWRIDANGNC